MWKLIVGNPWALAALFALGLAFGGSGAWWVQGLRLDALQAKYDGFVATTKAEGEAAKKLAEAKAKADRQLKESSDHEYETTIASLRADVKRMRDDRARSRFVPAAPAGSRSPDLACFDRAEYQRTDGVVTEKLFAGARGLADEGTAATVDLDSAKRWAQH